MKPSNFTDFPFSSALQNCESETIARNIMVILKRTGDTFRSLTFKEYQSEREKDGDSDSNEKKYFDKVIDYCKSADTAKLFSPIWAKAI